jgi:hypothetical protein
LAFALTTILGTASDGLTAIARAVSTRCAAVSFTGTDLACFTGPVPTAVTPTVGHVKIAAHLVQSIAIILAIILVRLTFFVVGQFG